MTDPEVWLRLQNTSIELLLATDVTRMPSSSDFGLLILQFGETIAPEERLRWVDQIADSHCSVVCAWGSGGTRWDDDVDHAIVTQNLDRGVDRFVMTTWHDNDSLEEVLTYFLHTASAGETRPERYAILLLGANGEQRHEVSSLAQTVWSERPA